MAAIACAAAVGASLLIVSLVTNVPADRWTGKARLAVVAFLLVAVAATMTTASALHIDPGPLNIWGLEFTLGGPPIDYLG